MLQRRLIDQEFGRNYKPDYVIMSMQEAKENDYEIVPIYLSKHVKETLEEEKESGSSSKFKWASDKNSAQMLKILCDFKQLLLNDLPTKNVSNYPKIAIFEIGFLWEPKNAPKPIFCPNQSLGVTTHM